MENSFEFNIDADQPMPTKAEAMAMHLRAMLWAFDIGVCEGCAYNNRRRPQKCSCCRRNPYMKDCYEAENNG